jgi:SEC-C motif-containing protein
MADCPCGGKDYTSCCAPYHQGAAAEDAQTMMRSRYSAYVLKLEGYLLATWYASTRPEKLELLADNSKWLGLEIKRHEVQSPDLATVEFVARYKIAGRAYRLHELSRFVREEGRWYYVEGDFKD